MEANELVEEKVRADKLKYAEYLTETVQQAAGERDMRELCTRIRGKHESMVNQRV